MKQELLKELFPSVMYNSIIFKSSEQGDAGIIKCFDSIMKESIKANSNYKLWITGGPSAGKSTALLLIRLYLIQNYPCKSFKYINLKNINLEENKILNELEDSINDNKIEIMILDSYDEIRTSKEKVLNLIKCCKKNIVVASRQSAENLNEKGMKALQDPLLYTCLADFQEIEVLDLEMKRIWKILVKNGIDISEISDEFVKFISNPMYIKLLLDAPKDKQKKLLLAENRAELIYENFLNLFMQKSYKSKKIQEEQEKLERIIALHTHLERIGECFFNQLTGGKDISTFVPNELKVFYYNSANATHSSHQEYEDFACGFYIAMRLQDYYKMIMKALSMNLNDEANRVYLFAGQILKILKKGEEIFENLNYYVPKKETVEYSNLIQIWLAFHDNVLENTDYFSISEDEDLICFVLNLLFLKRVDIPKMIVNIPTKEWIKEIFEAVWIPESKMLVKKENADQFGAVVTRIRGEIDEPKELSIMVLNIKNENEANEVFCYLKKQYKNPIELYCGNINIGFNYMNTNSSVIRKAAAIAKVDLDKAEVPYRIYNENNCPYLDKVFVYPSIEIFEENVMNEIQYITLLNGLQYGDKNSKETAINICKEKLKKAEKANDIDEALICKRAIREFVIATDEEYFALYNQIFETHLGKKHSKKYRKILEAFPKIQLS